MRYLLKFLHGEYKMGIIFFIVLLMKMGKLNLYIFPCFSLTCSKYIVQLDTKDFLCRRIDAILIIEHFT